MKSLPEKNKMYSHKRQSSSGSFNVDQNLYRPSFTSLENFMSITKLMQDEIMVPSKLKDKLLDAEKIETLNGELSEDFFSADVFDHYKFIMLIRNQFLKSNPFSNEEDDDSKTELKNKNFKKTYDNLFYHYNQLMSTLDLLSNETKVITDTYKDNV